MTYEDVHPDDPYRQREFNRLRLEVLAQKIGIDLVHGNALVYNVLNLVHEGKSEEEILVLCVRVLAEANEKSMKLLADLSFRRMTIPLGDGTSLVAKDKP